jgi:hypothetical protein
MGRLLNSALSPLSAQSAGRVAALIHFPFSIPNSSPDENRRLPIPGSNLHDTPISSGGKPISGSTTTCSPRSRIILCEILGGDGHPRQSHRLDQHPHISAALLPYEQAPGRLLGRQMPATRQQTGGNRRIDEAYTDNFSCSEWACKARLKLTSLQALIQ